MKRKKPLVALLRWLLENGEANAVVRQLRFAPRRVVNDALAERLDIVLSADQLGGKIRRVSTRFFFVAPGDWDCAIRPLSRTRAWRVMASIHEADGDWRRSAELAPLLARVRQGYCGGRDHPMRDRRDVERYFATRAELWERCRREGLSRDPSRPILFALGRDGAYFKASDGAHRLCCALLLGQHPIPGRIWQVHPGYLESFVKTLLRESEKAAPRSPAGSNLRG